MCSKAKALERMEREREKDKRRLKEQAVEAVRLKGALAEEGAKLAERTATAENKAAFSILTKNNNNHK